MPSFRLLCTAICLLCSLALPLSPLQAQTPAAQHRHVTNPPPGLKVTPPSPTPVPAKPQKHVKTFENFSENVIVFRFVNSHHSPAADVFFTHYYWLGNGFIVVFVAALVFIFRRKKFWILLLSVGIETIVVQVLKQVFDQPRPPVVLSGVHLLQPLQYHSFPSGDVALAFAMAVPLMVGEKWYTQALLILYATLIGYERMYLGVHFPLDVMTGALIGTLSGGLALFTIGKWRKATALTPAEPPATS